jgi:hypothetical protein
MCLKGATLGFSLAATSKMQRLVYCAAATAAALLVGGTAPAFAKCQLGNGIQHVVYLQFDNVHLRRDSPNVPSDLEQIPNEAPPQTDEVYQLAGVV